MWIWLTRLPVAIGGALLIGCWFYLTWNTTVGELVPSLRFRTKTTIAGVVQDTLPIFSAETLMTGEFQQAISREIGVLSPVFKPAIQLKSQLYFALFGSASSASIIVGKNQELLELDYLNEYCSRDLATLRPAAENWASRIRTMQDFFEQRGKVFIYLITPSKVAQSPQFIPDSFRCPAAMEDRTQKLPVYHEILQRHGVHVLDVATFLPAAAAQNGIDMFPRGGTHWNSLGAALAAARLVDAVNARQRTPPLVPFSFTWHVSYAPKGSDRDLLDLMNLPNADTHYPVPELSYAAPSPQAGCQTVRITEVGGSFLALFNGALEKLGCPADITYWLYWSERHLHFDGTRLHRLLINAGLRRKSLLEADVVIFEENESLAPGSRQGTPFMAEVKAMAAED